MVLFPLSLEAIIKRQRFIKAKTLSFSQTFALGRGRAGGRGQWGTPLALAPWVSPGSRSSSLGQKLEAGQAVWFPGCLGVVTRLRRDSSGTSVSSISRLSRGWVFGVSAVSPTCYCGISLVLSRPLRLLLGTCRCSPPQMLTFCSGSVHPKSEDT